MAIRRLKMHIARKNAGLTQKDMATRCNVSESTIANWENFRTEPTVAQATIYANACGLELDDILFLPKGTV